LESQGFDENESEIQASLTAFREFVQRWQGTVLLPVDQVLLTLAQDIFHEPAELALVHKLASLLRQAENANPSWRLGELAGELAVIARNERRFIGFSPEDTSFNPEKFKGLVVISTMHKAKGLEWDRVYLMSVNNYNFPTGDYEDTYLPERWFIRSSPNLGDTTAPGNHLNLQAEALAQFEVAYDPEMFQWYAEGHGTHEARLDYIRERLRLFYVGITRAKAELVITYNMGKRGNLHLSRPFEALLDYWERRRHQGISDQ
jgi:DNA helicase-2/ATP-dependent DNA helicase PcrA